MGLAFDAGGVLWTTGGTLREGPGYIWRVEGSGAVQQWCELPDALFMNGCTMHPNGRTLLACESASGHILAIDLGQPGRWEDRTCEVLRNDWRREVHRLHQR